MFSGTWPRIVNVLLPCRLIEQFARHLEALVFDTDQVTPSFHAPVRIRSDARHGRAGARETAFGEEQRAAKAVGEGDSHALHRAIFALRCFGGTHAQWSVTTHRAQDGIGTCRSIQFGFSRRLRTYTFRHDHRPQREGKNCERRKPQLRAPFQCWVGMARTTRPHEQGSFIRLSDDILGPTPGSHGVNPLVTTSHLPVPLPSACAYYEGVK